MTPITINKKSQQQIAEEYNIYRADNPEDDRASWIKDIRILGKKRETLMSDLEKVVETVLEDYTVYSSGLPPLEYIEDYVRCYDIVCNLVSEFTEAMHLAHKGKQGLIDHYKFYEPEMLEFSYESMLEQILIRMAKHAAPQFALVIKDMRTIGGDKALCLRVTKDVIKKWDKEENESNS